MVVRRLDHFVFRGECSGELIGFRVGKLQQVGSGVLGVRLDLADVGGPNQRAVGVVDDLLGKPFDGVMPECLRVLRVAATSCSVSVPWREHPA